MEEIRALELYSGVGGFHCAFRECGLPGDVTAAVDVNTTANATYRHNFSKTKLLQRNIQSLTAGKIDDLDVNFIWMSPPCQPFTRVGKKRDCQDSRTSSFLYLLDLIGRLKTRPRYIGLENVKGFETSGARNNFVSMLEDNGYTFQEFLLTPQQFGIPNSRLRYYAIAKLKPATFPFKTTGEVMFHLPGNTEVDSIPLSNFLESSSNPDSHLDDCLLSDDTLSKYSLILDIVSADSKNSCCFTKAYGHYVEGTGSVLQQNLDVALDNAYSIGACNSSELKLDALKSLKLRYFTTKEVGRLLGFPENFEFAECTTVRQRYRLFGNSLNVKVVSSILKVCFNVPSADLRAFSRRCLACSTQQGTVHRHPRCPRDDYDRTSVCRHEAMRRAHGANVYSSGGGRTDAFQEENEQLEVGLMDKTKALKSLCIDIGTEVRSQKKLIDGLDDDFDRTGGFLTSTVGRVGRLLKSGYNRYIFYLIVFSFFVFFVIYAIIKLR